MSSLLQRWWKALFVAGMVSLGLPARAAEGPANSVALEALSRLKDIDLEANPAVKAAVLRVVEITKGTPQFVELVRDFKLKDQGPALLDLALARPSDSTGADAARLLLAQGETNLLQKALAGPSAAKLATALGNTGEKQAVPLLEPLLTSARELEARQQAVRALAQTQEGVAAMLKLARADKFPSDLKLAAGSELSGIRWAHLKAEAAELLPPPQSQNNEALPPLSDLVKRQGDAARGERVFFSQQTGCGNCHQVNGRGVDFGPRLSEIGTKLGKDALYVSILDPNAGISFGYEAWQVELNNGDEAYGLLTSETEQEIAIKAQTGVITRIKKNDVAKRTQLKTSIMPSGLQQTMTLQEMVDLIEYLTTLKQAVK